MRRGGAGRAAHRRRWRGLALALAATAGSLLAGCGAEAVSTDREADVLVATCRSWLERTRGRGDLPIDDRDLRTLLAREPGAEGDRNAASALRAACVEAYRADVDASGSGPAS